MRSLLLLLSLAASASALSMTIGGGAEQRHHHQPRRAFLTKAASTAGGAVAGAVAVTAAGVASPAPALAAAGPEIITTGKGVKYAVTREAPKGGGTLGAPTVPQVGDIVAIDYTGYLTNGQIFDATHAEGKKNVLVFKLGEESGVIPGLNDVISQMTVGQKVQAIIPPSLAYGDKGVCLEKEDGSRGDCLIAPGSTLVYDVLLKKCSVPPP